MRAVPAHQGLRAAHFAGGKITLGLQVKDKFPIFQRCLHGAFNLLFVHHAVAVGLFVKLHFVSLHFFGFFQRQVGAVQHNVEGNVLFDFIHAKRDIQHQARIFHRAIPAQQRG